MSETLAAMRPSVHASPERFMVDLHVAHPLVKAGLHAVLREHDDIYVIESNGASSAARDATDVIVAETTDAVCRPSRKRGVAAAQTCRRIVAIGDGDSETSLLTALFSGARGFVSSRTVQAELPEAIRAVARGHGYLSYDMAGTLLNWMASQLPDDLNRCHRAAELLSSREREVLLLIGNGYSNNEIADQLVVSETTVRSHLYHILTKLDLRTRAQAVLFSYQFRLSNWITCG